MKLKIASNVFLIVVLLLSLTLATNLAWAVSPHAKILPPVSNRVNWNPGVLPPNSHPFGATYGEWSARWWKWAYSMPVNHNPLLDTADISTGQTGHVWFLGGTFGPPIEQGPGVFLGTANRTGTVPAGTALFFPIVNVEAATAEGNGDTEAELRAVAEWYINHTTNLTCVIDGRPVHNLQNYRVESPLFQYGPLPDNNIPQNNGFPDLGEGTISNAVSDGVWLMLEPLPVGHHTIHFTGDFVFTAAEIGSDIGYTLKLDITYNLTVMPGHGGH
jgi:hypothetical protein